MKIIVIGLNAAGAAFIARMRRLSESDEIVVYEESGYVSSSTCSLPYFIGEEIKDASLLNVMSKELLAKRFNIKININHQVISIDRKNRSIEIFDKKNNKVIHDDYDKLVIAAGSKAIKPSIKGIDNKRIYTLKDVDDAKRIKDDIAKNNYHNIAVIGGGFIGLEVGENLINLGLNVTFIEKSNQLFNNLDSDFASIVQKELIHHNAKIILNNGISSFYEDNGVTAILEDGLMLNFDAIILAIGVIPNSKIAFDANLELNEDKSIKVDKRFLTSDEHIYAIGDVIGVNNKMTSLATLASKQGRMLADIFDGFNCLYNVITSPFIIRLFSLSIASFGLNEKEAKKRNIDYEKIIITPLSNLSSFNGETMLIKVLFNKEKDILGASIIGGKGVDKRIDLLAFAMQSGIKIDALKDINLAYSPLYSSPKDPINMVGFVADNILSGIVKQYCAEDIPSLLNKDVILLDVRSKSEHLNNLVDGYTLNIPLDELRDNLAKLDKNKPIYLLCHSGIRSYIASRILSMNGYEAYNLAGGYYYLSLIK